MFNSITMVANVVRSPEKFEGANCAIAKVRLACNDGKEGAETLFIDAAFYGKCADNMMNLVTKGSRILVQGRLVSRSWENKNTGKKETKMEIAGNLWQFLDKKENRGEPSVEIKDEDLPF